MRRLGIIEVSRSYFEDYVIGWTRAELFELSLEKLIELIRLPGIFIAKSHHWDFDTDSLRIIVESPILPLHLEGELICSVDLIYEEGIPTKCLIYNRTVIKEQAYEKQL